MKPDAYGRTNYRLERFTEAIAFLMKEPRKILELAAVMDVSSESGGGLDVVYNYVRVLHESGLVYIKEWRAAAAFANRVTQTVTTTGRPVAVWAWQSRPFECADAPRPS